VVQIAIKKRSLQIEAGPHPKRKFLEYQHSPQNTVNLIKLRHQCSEVAVCIVLSGLKQHNIIWLGSIVPKDA
jgi:hypothetical protein